MSTSRTEQGSRQSGPTPGVPEGGDSRATAAYQEHIDKDRKPNSQSLTRSPEDELDNIISGLSGESQEPVDSSCRLDPVGRLRELTVQELIPEFAQLVEKYASAGITMRMDASNFLEGGREIRLEFGIGDHRALLLGTVTAEAIAFHETRYSPAVNGEVVSGPMLRLRGLTAQVFRQFICQRLTIILRAMPRTR